MNYKLKKITEFTETEMFFAVDRFPTGSIDGTGGRSMTSAAAPDRFLVVRLFVNDAQVMTNLIDVITFILTAVGLTLL